MADKDGTQLDVTPLTSPPPPSGCTSHPNADRSSLICLVQEPDPNQPKPEGPQMTPLDGENLMVSKWPPSLPAALQRWGTTQPKSPCLTALDNAGKPVYTLTYGRHSLAINNHDNNNDANHGVLCLSFFIIFYCMLPHLQKCMLNCVGKLWTRSQKLAYTLLNKLSTRNEPLLVPGDRVSRLRSEMHCNLLQTLLTRSRLASF